MKKKHIFTPQGIIIRKKVNPVKKNPDRNS